MLIGKDIQQAQHLHKLLMIGLEKLMIKDCGAVLLDFSATFDIIDHSLLLEKLVEMCYGFNGSLSNKIQVESGIHQGSCLGPLPFSIFTNDI